MASLSNPSSFVLLPLPILPPKKSPLFLQRNEPRIPASVIMAATSSLQDKNAPPCPTKLVTFLGKGGSGKTTSAVFAAQHYAMSGLKTCLVVHSQDPTAEYLLNCKIGTLPVVCNDNLSAVRLETTNMLLEPLHRLKQADARLNMTQGVLEGVVGEELGVLPGMDSIFSALALERFVGFLREMPQKNHQKDKFDIIIYDGISTEETIRMMGATSKVRLYLKYMRNLAEKTDLGRLAGPSLLRLLDESLNISSRSPFNGSMSSEVWDDLEKTLERGSSLFAEPRRFACYLVMDSTSRASVNSALRYWGCTIQAGAQVSGAFSTTSSCVESEGAIRKNFSPLPLAFSAHLSVDTPLDWKDIILSASSKDSRNLLAQTTDSGGGVTNSVKFDPSNKSITLFMPGFDKSEIRLYQFRGGSELLVEAGDQRRVIPLPSQIQGKVGGAKFMDRNLIITMR